MFQDCGRDDVREQITRVLLERLIVHRPHPWGLLISFIELIKNPRYKFWSYGFTRCASEIEKVFESVARSCMCAEWEWEWWWRWRRREWWWWWRRKRKRGWGWRRDCGRRK